MGGPPQKLIREIAEELGARSDPFERRRVEAFFESVLTGRGEPPDPRQRPRIGVFPGLGARPFHEPSSFSDTERVTSVLEGEFGALRDEYLHVAKEYGDFFLRCKASDRYDSLTDNDWGSFIVWERGELTRAAEIFFPITCAVVRQVVEFVSPLDEVSFLCLKPGIRLPPHTDATNLTLTCHLGISIPSRCGLRVAGEMREWEEGRCLWFDHSYEHEAWNESDEPRVILLLDVMHPELTAAERLLLAEYTRLLAEKMRG